MQQSPQSLWPETIGPTPLPTPVRILQEQGEALEKTTKGQLYGVVERPSRPLLSRFTYEFYLGVTNKHVRHKLLTVQCEMLSDYPVTVEDHQAGTTFRVPDEQAFRDRLRLIFNASVTQDILSRLLAFAKG